MVLTGTRTQSASHQGHTCLLFDRPNLWKPMSHRRAKMVKGAEITTNPVHMKLKSL